MAMIRLKSDSQGRDSFILHLAPSAIDLPSARRGGPIRLSQEARVKRVVLNALPEDPGRYRKRAVESVLCIQA